MNCIAQLDTVHYIPPMHSRDVGQVEDHYVYLSTPETVPFNVVVTDGSGTPYPGSPFTLSNAAPVRIDVGNGQVPATKLVVPIDSLNTVLSTEGLILTANKPFFANARYRASVQAEALSAKGKAAFGQTFRIGAAPIIAQQNIRSFVVGFMATENNTTVNLTDYDPNIVFNGTPNVTQATTTVTLDAGESYVISGYANHNPNLQGIVGALLTSDKPIVVNCGNWNGSVAVPSGQDICIDQIVPIENVGNNYVVVEGNGPGDHERPLVVAHYNNTQVFVNGAAAPVATLQAGDWFLIDNVNYTGVGHRNMYIQTSQPAYVFQFLGGDNLNTTPGMNFIPPLSCGLPKEVDLIPDCSRIGNTTYNGGVFAVTLAGSTVSINGVPQAGAEPVGGSGQWETYKLPNLTGDIRVTSTGPLAVGLFGANSDAGFAGYYSGFSTDVKAEIQIASAPTLCENDTAIYVFTGDTITGTNYSWYFDDPNAQIISGSGLDTHVVYYNTIGTKSVELVLDYQGCTDTARHILTMYEGYEDFDTLVGCDSVNWEGAWRTATGDYQENLFTVQGCDSLMNLNLTIYHPVTTQETQAACDSFAWNGNMYYNSGTYAEVLTTIYGCDSTATLMLTINDAETVQVQDTVCDSVQWNNQMIYTSGQYNHLEANVLGCDSTTVYDVTVFYAQTTSSNYTTCNQSDTLPHYTYFTDIYGCDSTHIQEPIILQTHEEFDTLVGCDSVQWENMWYNYTGEYQVTYTNIFGCDSVRNLRLTIHQSRSSNETFSSCEPYSWNGQLLENTGNYQYSTTTIQGCDSIVNIFFTRLPGDQVFVSDTICDSLQWNGDWIASTGNYEYNTQNVLGCDSSTTLYAFVVESPETESEYFTCDVTDVNPHVYYFVDQYGCDSMHTEYPIQVDPSEYPVAQFTAGPEVVYYPGGSLETVNTSYNYSSLWWETEGMNFYSEEENPVLDNFPGPGIYVLNLFVENEFGCLDSTSAEFNIELDDFIFVPSAFTPDGNKRNPVFKPSIANYDAIKAFYFRIYDRWGHVVFETLDPRVGWDGTVKGKTAKDGMFTYTMEYTLLGETMSNRKVGTVALLR